MWANDTWEKKKTVAIQMPAGKTPSGDTRVQFNSDQSRLLVVHETQLAIYDASKMERIYQVAYHIFDENILSLSVKSFFLAIYVKYLSRLVSVDPSGHFVSAHITCIVLVQ